MSAAEFDPLSVLQALHRHRVDFVCIGGFSAYLQGSAIPTVDVDIVPDASRDNLTRLSEALQELGARVRNGDEEPQPFAHDATSLAGLVFWNLTTCFGDLDISFTPSGTQGFGDLRQDALTVDLHGTPVLLASLADVIRSKEAANRDKDRRVLPGLRRLLDEQRRAQQDRARQDRP